MKQGESGYRRYTMEPVQTVLHERRTAGAPSIADAGSPAGSEPVPTVLQAIAVLPGPIRGLRRVLVVDDDEVIRR